MKPHLNHEYDGLIQGFTVTIIPVQRTWGECPHVMIVLIGWLDNSIHVLDH